MTTRVASAGLLLTAGLLISAAFLCSGQIPTANLRFHYPLDGDTVDVSGNNEHATAAIKTFTSDRYGAAGMAYLNDDGNLSGIVNTTQYMNPQEFTVSYWFRSDNGGTKIDPGTYSVISTFADNTSGTSPNHDRTVRLMPDGTLVAHVLPGAGVLLNTTEAFDDDAWHHVALCLSATRGFELFVDGTLRDSDPATTSAQSRNGYWRFGGWLVNARNAYYGSLDEILVYDRALSIAEIEAVYGSYPIVTTLTGTDATSIEGVDGSIHLDVEGGVPPYTFAWSNGSASQHQSGLWHGVYSVTVTDAEGESVKDSIRIFGSFVDARDGKVYRAVHVGDQIWMADNLNNGTRLDGSIPMTSNGISDKYCYDDLESNCDTYGALYQWNEMMYYGTVEGQQGACPDGWLLPTKTDVEILVGEIGGYTTAGGVMKDTSSLYWEDPNTGAGNASGMSLQGNGSWSVSQADFVNLGFNGHIVTSTEIDGSTAEVLHVYHDRMDAEWDPNSSKSNAYNVRCIKDLCTFESISFETTGPDCQGTDNATIHVVLSGGTPPFTYLWSTGDTTSSLDSLEAGVYEVLVTDYYGCEIEGEVEIPEAPFLEANAGPDTILCDTFEMHLQALVPEAGETAWRQLQGPALLIFEDTTDAHSKVTLPIPGSYQLQWRVSRGVCLFTDEVVISLNSLDPNIPVCVKDTVLILDENCEAALPDYTEAPELTIFDCSPYTVSQSPVPGTVITDTTVVTITVTDIHGNASTCDFTVNILDTIPPVITSCVTDKVLLGDLQCTAALPDYTLSEEIQATDCFLDTILQIPEPGTVISDSTVVTLMVVDSFQNASSCEFIASLTNDETLMKANAGPDQGYCGVLTANLQGNVLEVGAGMWSLVEGPGQLVIEDPASSTSLVTADTAGTYILRWTITNGACSSSDDVNMVFKENPSDASGGPDQEVCDGEEVTLIASGGVNYTWDQGVENGVPFVPAESGEYHVEVMGANGCKIVDTVWVTVHPLPEADAGPDQDVCFGQSVTLSASGGVQYFWSNDVLNGVPFIPFVTDDYQVVVVDENGCTNSDKVTVTVHPVPPRPVVTLVEGTLHSDAPAGNQWYRNQVIIEGATGTEYVPTQSGNYYTIVTVDNCSSVPSNAIDFRMTGLETRGKAFLEVFPNPTEGLLTIRPAGAQDLEGCTVRITGSDGRVLFSAPMEDREITVNLAEKGQGGIYILQLLDPGGSVLALRRIVLY